MAGTTIRSTRRRRCSTGSSTATVPPHTRGIFEYYRQLAEEIRRGQMPGPMVRLRAPRGISHVQLFSGIHRAVAADGTVEMTESDAAPLLNAGWARVDPGDWLAQDAVV